MNAAIPTIRISAIAALACATLSSAGLAQTTLFQAPVRMQAAEEMLGMDRLYPSPVAHDLNRDGHFDIVVGDLRGNLTFALQNHDGTFTSEQDLKDASGKILDFGNW